MKAIEQKYNWSDWRTFSDPRNGDYLVAPFGFGVYQLQNNKTNEFILVGRSKNAAFRMSSLLPSPLGQGNRDNDEKYDYVHKHIIDIEYRTVAFTLDLIYTYFSIYTRVRHKQKKRNRMINLLQENKEIESHRTNCTFGFLPTHWQTQKNQKSNFLPTLKGH